MAAPHLSLVRDSGRPTPADRDGCGSAAAAPLPAGGLGEEALLALSKRIIWMASFTSGSFAYILKELSIAFSVTLKLVRMCPIS